MQQYVYDGLDLLAEVSAVGQLQAGYTHGPGIDDPLIARYNNANYYYHKNHQGSVTEITGGNQSIVKTYKYDAYGNILQETGPTLTGGFTYTARELHTRSGLYYYRARFYDPRTGRFLTQDPIGFLGGVNLYAYVVNDPVNWLDPFGFYKEEVHRDLTYELALKCGIHPKIAVQIADADQGLDAGLTYPLFRPGLHFMSRSEAEMRMSKALRMGDFEAFGQALHMFQDSFSHQGISPIEHIRLGDAPDIYCENSARDTAMREWTERWLKEFHRRFGRFYAAQPIRGVVSH